MLSFFLASASEAPQQERNTDNVDTNMKVRGEGTAWSSSPPLPPCSHRARFAARAHLRLAALGFVCLAVLSSAAAAALLLIAIVAVAVVVVVPLLLLRSDSLLLPPLAAAAAAALLASLPPPLPLGRIALLAASLAQHLIPFYGLPEGRGDR